MCQLMQNNIMIKNLEKVLPGLKITQPKINENKIIIITITNVIIDRTNNKYIVYKIFCLLKKIHFAEVHSYIYIQNNYQEKLSLFQI